MLDSLVRVTRRVGWVTDLLAANHESASAGENPARPASRRPHRHHGTNPDNRRRQACPAGSPLRFQRASSFGPPDNREKPMGPGRGDQLFAHGTGVTPAKPSPKEQAGNLHSRAQSGAFSLTRVRRGVLPAVGSAHPGDCVTHKRPEQPPERGHLPGAASFAVVRRLNPTAFELRGPTRFTLSGFTYS